MWSNYSYRSPAGGGELTGYRREFKCVVVDLVAFPPVPDDWTATAADEADLRRLFADYYAKRDGGSLEAAYAMFTPGNLPDRAGWLGKMRQFQSRIGTGQRRITGIRWVVNPPGAAHPGAFAVISFDGDFANANFYCGTLAVYRKGPGAYLIEREDHSFYPRGDEMLTPTQPTRMKREQCPQ